MMPTLSAASPSVLDTTELCNLFVKKLEVKPSDQGTAAAAVFNTAELCEMILLNLSFYDLLRSRQLSRYFRNVIKGSKPLQQALYLLHTPSSNLPREVNPLAARCLRAHGFFPGNAFSSKPGSRDMEFVWLFTAVDHHPLARFRDTDLLLYFGDMLVYGKPCITQIAHQDIVKGTAVCDEFTHHVTLREVREVLERRQGKIADWTRVYSSGLWEHAACLVLALDTVKSATARSLAHGCRE